MLGRENLGSHASRGSSAACGTGLLLLLALLACQPPAAHTAGRSGAFHGYTEKDPAPSPPDALAPANTSGSSGKPPFVTCRDTNSACADWALQGECKKNKGYMEGACPVSCQICTPPELNAADFQGERLVISTEVGEIRIRLMWDLAPRTCALIMDLAHQPDGNKEGCRLYRNEAVPEPETSGGPPYGLLQGGFSGLLRSPPQEGLDKGRPTRGYVAMIQGGDFYISLMDHGSWGSAHTVWGKVEDMAVVDRIVVGSPYRNFTHPQFKTVMRMMEKEMPFVPRPEKLPELELAGSSGAEEGHEL